MKVAFKPSKTVAEIKSGRTRDDSFDEPVKVAYAAKGQVFEAEYPNDEVDEVRRGLARSALYLKVRVATDFEEIEPDVTDKDGNVTKVGKTVVRFSAHDKMPRNGSRKVETATTDADGSETGETETATV